MEHLDQERVDEAIWRGAGIKSVRTLAAETGLKPEEVLRRKNELLDEIDVLTAEQARQRLLIDLQKIARTAQEDYERSPWETKSGLLNSSIAAMKQIFSEMNRLEKMDNSRVQELNQLRIRELGRLVDTAVMNTLDEISRRYGVPADEMEDLFRKNLISAAQELEEPPK